MKYETKIIKGKFTEVWEEMIQDDYELVYFSETHLISFWKKEIKRTVKPIAWKESPEYLEFIKFYRKEINDKSSFANTIPRKYELALEDKDDTGNRITHQYIMNSLRDYKDHLKAFNKPPVWVQVFLNQRRYIEKYQTVKVNYEEKWEYYWENWYHIDWSGRTYYLWKRSLKSIFSYIKRYRSTNDVTYLMKWFNIKYREYKEKWQEFPNELKFLVDTN